MGKSQVPENHPLLHIIAEIPKAKIQDVPWPRKKPSEGLNETDSEVGDSGAKSDWEINQEDECLAED